MSQSRTHLLWWQVDVKLSMGSEEEVQYIFQYHLDIKSWYKCHLNLTRAKRLYYTIMVNNSHYIIV